MPVPSVTMITTPAWPLPAPKATSATPAASASFTTVTSPPMAAAKSFPASVPIHSSSTFAAECATPSLITAGNVAPAGPDHSKNSASSATTAVTASGVAGCGVRMR